MSDDKTIEGLRFARQTIQVARAHMKGQSGDYVRGWRAALNEVDYWLKLEIAAHER